MDKLLDFIRLEPVESFKPGCEKKISGKTELLIRLVIDLLVASVFCFVVGKNGFVMNMFIACNGIFLTEFLWSGFKRFGYVQDIIIHIVAIVAFTVVTVICDNHLVGLAVMGMAKCLTEFEYKNLYNMEIINNELLEDWESYATRNYKITFIMLLVFGFVILKFLNIV